CVPRLQVEHLRPGTEHGLLFRRLWGQPPSPANLSPVFSRSTTGRVLSPAKLLQDRGDLDSAAFELLRPEELGPPEQLLDGDPFLASDRIEDRLQADLVLDVTAGLQ